ncbi:MAG: hypothetical protein EP343_09505 [Deltaproteobacteria bacterium]|nr:MAG: hypothetical protein EP343_09505 [Deltaproteobacteria bacterium]
MKNITKKTMVALLAALLAMSGWQLGCGGGTGETPSFFDNSLLTQAISQSGAQVHKGATPPTIVGSYYLEGRVTAYLNTLEESKEIQIPATALTISEQLANNQVEFSIRRETQAYPNAVLPLQGEHKGMTSISGTGDQFSIVVKLTMDLGEEPGASPSLEGCKQTSLLLISGSRFSDSHFEADFLNTVISIEGCKNNPPKINESVGTWSKFKGVVRPGPLSP